MGLHSKKRILKDGWSGMYMNSFSEMVDFVMTLWTDIGVTDVDCKRASDAGHQQDVQHSLQQQHSSIIASKSQVRRPRLVDIPSRERYREPA